MSARVSTQLGRLRVQFQSKIKGMTMRKDAILSECGTYRYRLDREWNNNLSKIAFIMLNPSIADADIDDPTIRRCISFAEKLGHGGLVVGNLFALRSTSPKNLYNHVDPVGIGNDIHLISIARSVERVVCAWGTHGKFMHRDNTVREILKTFRPLNALKITADGSPGHPLYIPSETKLLEF